MKLLSEIINCLYKAGESVIDHDGIEHAGYMAFLTLLSLFPFLVFIIAVSGFVGTSEIGEKFIRLLLESIPSNVSHALEPRITELLSGPPQGLVTLALIGVIWTASSAVEGLRTILNRVYRVKNLPPYIFRRLLSIIQFLLLSAVIFIATMILIVLPIIWDKLQSISIIGSQLSALDNIMVPLGTYFALLRYIVFFATLVLAVASLYYIIPNAKLPKSYVFPGAILVVILWYMGGKILTIYLQNFKQLNLVYGSLGGVIVTLLFFYIINVIFIYGAEFNYLFGSLITRRSARSQ